MGVKARTYTWTRIADFSKIFTMPLMRNWSAERVLAAEIILYGIFIIDTFIRNTPYEESFLWVNKMLLFGGY